MEEGSAGGPPRVEITRYQSLPLPVKIFCLVLWVIGIVLSIFYVFAWQIGDWILQDVTFYYLMYACFSTTVFLTMSARKKDKNRLPWYDVVLAAFVFVTMVYFALHTWEIGAIGWVPAPHTLALVLACVITPITIEGGRRMAGWAIVILILIMGFYPLVAPYMPGILFGPGMPWDILMPSFTYGRGGMLGIPAQIMGSILIGFLIFAGVLLASGAGKFFLDLALALMGRFRG